MACSTMKISACTHSMLPKDSVFESRGLRRSASEPQLRWSVDPLKKASAFAGTKLRTSHSMSVLPFSGFTVRIPIKPALDEPEGWQLIDSEGEDEEMFDVGSDRKRVNWVQRILELRRQWKEKGKEDKEDNGIEEHCDVSYDDDDDGRSFNEVFDKGSFERYLTEVQWTTTKLFSKFAFLCNMAYTIPDIKADDLTEYYGLDMVTSSLEKKMTIDDLGAKIESDPTCIPMRRGPSGKRKVKPSVAYQIAASAASYVHSRAKGLLSLNSRQPGEDSNSYKPEVAACMAASTMATVVAVEEKAKQEAARELRSLHSSPCEWFVCDDRSTCTRIFVIQGSDSLASWQANLMFEPTKFEGTDALVHRGIYEAAKGIYEQFMPEIKNHLDRWGTRARFQFAGHSLGGSLSLLVNLMLLARGDIPRSMLLPVITFGSPFVFCGGHRILEELGLDEDNVWSVMMHRDIVPRAFACTYPNHVSQILKRLNGTFRSHPCLNKEKLLYSPLGKLFILQPDENYSPPHPFLPSGSGLYALENKGSTSRSELMAVLRAFLNSPHPLETLSDPKAYGSEGTILRDHDSRNYVKAVNSILRQHTKSMVRSSRVLRLQHLWPLLTATMPEQSCCYHHQKQLYQNGQGLDRHDLTTKEVVSGA